MFKKQLDGFMGKTHALLSICLMALCMILPLYPINTIFGQLKDNILLYIVSLVILIGGSLLPDLDNSKSSAGSTLGPLGSIFTLFMQSTSSIVWNLYHFSGDKKPSTQHRYLWHTPIMGIGIILLFYFGLPKGDYTIFTNIKNSIDAGMFGRFIQTNAILILYIILCFMATLVGANMLLFTLSKLFPIPWFVKYILPTGVLVYIATATYSDLRVVGVCLGAGYLFHCLEDFFADTGIPLIWPIPKFWGSNKKVWWRPLLPLRVTTGGTVNTILDLVALVGAIGLMIFAFVRR